MTDYYDKANCAYYDTCDLQARAGRRGAADQPHLRLDATHPRAADDRVRAVGRVRQHAQPGRVLPRVVNDPGPVANDNNTDLEVVVFNSSTDYQTYAGALFGIDTNNGGMYLEGNPAAAGNQAALHRLRGGVAAARRSRSGTSTTSTPTTSTAASTCTATSHAEHTTPTIWWIEGFAEYVSYSYRNVTYTAAITEAAKRTYTLSTLFSTTYSHDTTRIYRWGYLAVRYMMQSHPRRHDHAAGPLPNGQLERRPHLPGFHHRQPLRHRLVQLAGQCAAGNCGGGTTNQPPTASFTYTTSGLTASFTDRSTDPDGTIASRSWTFGDGTSSTATNPAKTYATAGTYPSGSRSPTIAGPPPP